MFNYSFRFSAAKALVGYFHRLGISHIYASPIFRARPGSMHGYDIVDPNQINPELGTQRELKLLVKGYAQHGIGWIQDVVPNHMVYEMENPYLKNIFELGEFSRYSRIFDIDWRHPAADLQGKLLAPFLGKPYEECLRSRELELVYEHGFWIKYYDKKFPTSLKSYHMLLAPRIKTIRERSNRDSGLYQLRKLLLQSRRSSGVVQEQADEEISIRGVLDRAYVESEDVRKIVGQILEEYNTDSMKMDELMVSQNFRLVHWKGVTKAINYRRFFNINELIGIRVEDESVWNEVHRLLLSLVKDGRISGIRIDHIDGLYNPREYLDTLSRLAPSLYIIAEKILGPDEELPEWPIQGTTGYDFLDNLNKIFVKSSNEKRFTKLYQRFTGEKLGFRDVLYKTKRSVIESEFAGDLDNIVRILTGCLRRKGNWFGNHPDRIRDVVIEICASFPVYRSYVSRETCSDGPGRYLKQTFHITKQRCTKIEAELDAVEMLLNETCDRDVISFIMRFQQFTGPIMAKGLEDTALYLYNRLLSLNDVGSDPGIFGISIGEFNRFIMERHRKWKFSMNATSTHDTKRGEDVRARLNVLSEIPSEWASKTHKWSQMNGDKKSQLSERMAPSLNEEYYLYQTLIGTFPFEAEDLHAYGERIKDHMIKAVREARVNSSWAEKDIEYERAIAAFIDHLLDPSEDNNFLKDFLPFQKKVAYYGIFNSLSQTLVKITAPGVPDFYQGSELWDFNLVDPDNRRPVDYGRRGDLLRRVIEIQGKVAKWQGEGALETIFDNLDDGLPKLYLIYKALRVREEREELFAHGAYLPTRVEGKWKRHVLAFSRKAKKQWSITIAPRFLTDIIDVGKLPVGEVWDDTRLILPTDAPRQWKEVLGGGDVGLMGSGTGGPIYIGKALEKFPVALLVGDS